MGADVCTGHKCFAGLRTMLKIRQNETRKRKVTQATSGEVKRPELQQTKHLEPYILALVKLKISLLSISSIPDSTQTSSEPCYSLSHQGSLWDDAMILILFQGVSTKTRSRHLFVELKQCNHSSSLLHNCRTCSNERSQLRGYRTNKMTATAPTAWCHCWRSHQSKGAEPVVNKTLSQQSGLFSAGVWHSTSVLYQFPGTNPRSQCANIIWSFSSDAKLGRD